VERVGDQLLAGAVLALDEDVRLAGRDALDELEQVLHLLALADHVLELVAILQLRLELLVLVDQRFLFDGFLQLVEEPLGIDRLFEEVERARLHRLDRPRNVSLPGDDDDFGFRVELLELADELNPVDVGEHHVGDDRVGTPGLEQLFAAGADERGADFVAGMFEQDLQPLGHRRLIVYREYALLTLETHTGSKCIETA
jgi:hypothetical protein